jgi:hypothetical protein
LSFVGLICRVIGHTYSFFLAYMVALGRRLHGERTLHTSVFSLGFSYIPEAGVWSFDIVTQCVPSSGTLSNKELD